MLAYAGILRIEEFHFKGNEGKAAEGMEEQG